MISLNENGIGGFKECVFMITGQGAYSRMKYESGVHRVQRVPETESGGRIHTSTITVAVMPEAEDVDVVIDEKDIRIDVMRASGNGGQCVNTTDSAVRLTHYPTGIVIYSQTEKSAVAEPAAEKEDIQKDVPAKPAIRLFSFSNLDSVIHAARLLHPMYHGANTLYKNETNGIFILALAQSAHTNSEFSKICNMLSEYGSFEKASGAVLAYLEEHCQTVISADAVRHLAEI